MQTELTIEICEKSNAETPMSNPVELTTIKEVFETINEHNIDSFLLHFEHALRYVIEIKKLDSQISVASFTFDNH